MTPYELDKFVRENSPDGSYYRVYDEREVERMREIAAGGNTSQILRTIIFMYEKAFRELEKIREEYREKKEFEISDKLRSVLMTAGLSPKDNKCG